jgi:hypothetical protein
MFLKRYFVELRFEGSAEKKNIIYWVWAVLACCSVPGIESSKIKV